MQRSNLPLTYVTKCLLFICTTSGGKYLTDIPSISPSGYVKEFFIISAYVHACVHYIHNHTYSIVVEESITACLFVSLHHSLIQDAYAHQMDDGRMLRDR